MDGFSLPSVQPTHLEILNDRGGVATNSVIGPYKEGASVNVTCMSSGGKCLVMTSNDTFLHTITSSSPFPFPLWLLWTNFHNFIIHLMPFALFDSLNV
jgi:hypothetical protein